jgi:hypothetical protein
LVVVKRWNETIRFIDASSFGDVNISCLSNFMTESAQSGLEKWLTILIYNPNSRCHAAYEMFNYKNVAVATVLPHHQYRALDCDRGLSSHCLNLCDIQLSSISK